MQISRFICRFGIRKNVVGNVYMRYFCADVTSWKSFIHSVVEGSLHTQQVFPYPSILSSEQEEFVKLFLDSMEKAIGDKIDPLKYDANEEMDPELAKTLKELGAYGIMTPEVYGGVGLTNTQYARISQLISRDLAIGIILGAHQSIGYKGITLFGTEEQKQKYLPRLATGELIAAYCLTEPGSGSDSFSITTKAELTPDGKHYILNGSKVWISNGGIADIFTVFAKTPATDKSGKVVQKISAFIVERKFGGVTSSGPEKKMGIKCSNTASVYFDNVKIPAENLLGELNKGFKIAMEILNNGRFGMGSVLSGSMRICIAKAVQHASERKQFNTLLKDFGGIQEKIATMQVKHYMTESMSFLLAMNMDRGVKEYETEAAICKVYGSESAWYCADEAIQILGGMGFMRECGLEKILRDLRIFRIFEGTNEILRLLLVGVCLKSLQKSSKPKDYMIRQIKHSTNLSYLSNLSILNKHVHPSLSSSAKLLSKAITIISYSINSSVMKYKKDIMKENFKILRYGDCLIEIYGMGAVLSRATKALNEQTTTAQHEKMLAELGCELSYKKIMEALHFVNLENQGKLKNMKLITDELCENGRTINPSPLGF